MKKTGIYALLCETDGKMYIGSSVNIDRRISSHLSQLRHRKHTNQHLQRAFDKYSESSFHVIILQYCETHLLQEMEQYYINQNIDCLFNETYFAYRPAIDDRVKEKISQTLKRRIEAGEVIRGGQRFRKYLSEETEEQRCIRLQRQSCAQLGHSTSDETREKIGNSNRGRKLSIERKQQISICNRGRKTSDVTKAKIAAKSRGHIINEQGRKKISDAVKKSWVDGKQKDNSHFLTEHVKNKGPWNKGKKCDTPKNAIQVQRSDGMVFKSLTDAAIECKCSIATIRNALKSGGLFHGWSFVFV